MPTDDQSASSRRQQQQRQRGRLIIAPLSLVLALLWGCSDPMPPALDGAGTTGLGDPVLPNLGNGGYDVLTYDIHLDFDSSSKEIDALTIVTLNPTQELTRFNLELQGFEINNITIDTVPAKWDRYGVEVVITPERPLVAGNPVDVAINYIGVPKPLETDAFGENGWFNTGDVVVVAGQPDGAASWYPVNDHPIDKAMYRIGINLPKSFTAGANGTLANKKTTNGKTLWQFETAEPQASYLTTVIFGENLVRVDSPPAKDGTPIRHYFERSIAAQANATMAPTADMIEFYSSIFGPYPFEVYGAAVVDAPLGFALETQTLSVFDPDELEEWAVAHEIAHQWVGNHVSLKSWSDIWLNEGFANYAEQLWFDHSVPGYSIDDTLTALANNEELSLNKAPGTPTANSLFSDSSYYRGGLTFHALRTTIGDQKFFKILPAWVEAYGGSNATTNDFIALAEQISGRELTDFFDAWIFNDEMPQLPWAKRSFHCMPEDDAAAAQTECAITSVTDSLKLQHTSFSGQ